MKKRRNLSGEIYAMKPKRSSSSSGGPNMILKPVKRWVENNSTTISVAILVGAGYGVYRIFKSVWLKSISQANAQAAQNKIALGQIEAYQRARQGQVRQPEPVIATPMTEDDFDADDESFDEFPQG